MGISQYCQPGFCQIDISLNNHTYIIQTKTLIIEKKYTEQLSEKEIDNVVGSELKRHRDFIEEKTKKV